MERSQKKVFKIVLGAHIAVLGLLCSGGLISHLLQPKPEVVIPVEFVVDTRPQMPDPADALPQLDEPEPEPPAEPEVVIPEPKPEPVKPKPKKPKKSKRKRPKIEISHKRVGSPRPNPLTEAQIRKLLDSGAVAGDHTSIPDEDARCMAAIKNTLYALWDQPSLAVAGNASAAMRLRLGSDGVVRSAVVYRKSGNAELDNSVMAVAGSIKKIRGLTAGFLRRHPNVTISFKVE